MLDVGTGTGRAALLLARGGAHVTAVDASEEMLAVARQRARRAAASRSSSSRGDAHALDFADRSFDVGRQPARADAHAGLAAVVGRAVPRRRSARDRRLPVGDAAWRWSSRSCARLLHAVGATDRAVSRLHCTRAIDRRAVRLARLPHPIGAPAVRAADRAAQGDRLARGSRRGREGCSTAPACCACSVAGRRSSPNGARPQSPARPDSPAATWPARSPRRGTVSARWSATRTRAGRRSRAAGVEIVAGDLRDASGARPPRVGGVDVVYHIAAIYRQAGLPAETYRAVNARAVGRCGRGRGARPASGGSCTAARSACTATSSIRRPTRTRRSSRATSIRSPSSKASGWRARRRPARASR